MVLFAKKKTSAIADDIEEIIGSEPSSDLSDYPNDAALVGICEKMQSNQQDAKMVRKTLQEKMLSNDPQVQARALKILTSLSENGVSAFIDQLSTSKSFGKSLKKLADKNHNDNVNQAFMRFLDTCMTLKPVPEAVQSVYTKLSHGTGAPSARHLDSSAAHTRVESQPPVDPTQLIDMAKNSAELLSSTLAHTDPTLEDIKNNELIKEFHRKCKRIQIDINRYLETSDDEDINCRLFAVNRELLASFKEYDDMVEQHAVNEATKNSQQVHHRNTKQVEDNNSPESTSSGAAGSYEATAQASSSKERKETFDPFDDGNVSAATSSNAGPLPAALTPEVVHR